MYGLNLSRNTSNTVSEIWILFKNGKSSAWIPWNLSTPKTKSPMHTSHVLIDWQPFILTHTHFLLLLSEVFLSSALMLTVPFLLVEEQTAGPPAEPAGGWYEAYCNTFGIQWSKETDKKTDTLQKTQWHIMQEQPAERKTEKNQYLPNSNSQMRVCFFFHLHLAIQQCHHGCQYPCTQ